MTPTLREAAQQALEALETHVPHYLKDRGYAPITALRAALAASAAPAEPYDQQSLELCNVCGWKTMIPGDACLNCERDKPATPAEPVAVPAGWKLVPVEPNTAMLEAGVYALYEASAGDIDATRMEVSEAYRSMIAATAAPARQPLTVRAAIDLMSTSIRAQHQAEGGE